MMYRYMREEIEKLAEEKKKPEHPAWTIGKVVGANALGMSIGVGLGMAAVHGMDRAGLFKTKMSPTKAVPIAAAAGYITGKLQDSLRSSSVEEVRRAVQDWNDRPKSDAKP